VDWDNNIAAIMQNRCASCHGQGKSAQQLTGLLLDGSRNTYQLLTENRIRDGGGNTLSPVGDVAPFSVLFFKAVCRSHAV